MIQRGKGGYGGRWRWTKGTERDFAFLPGEINGHELQYANDILIEFTFEICMVLETNVIPINSITIKNHLSLYPIDTLVHSIHNFYIRTQHF